MGKNRINFEKDPNAEEDMTPVFVTAHTPPQFPGASDSFKVSGKLFTFNVYKITITSLRIE